MILPRGSEWRKWDFHIHSPLSILNNQYAKKPDGTVDWDAFVDRLEKANLAVIAITDYFTIEGYKKLRELQQTGGLKDVTILPNVEFRLNSLIASKKDGANPRRLNFHVIFSDEVSAQDIEEHFLHDLHFYYEGNPQDKDETRKLKVSNLEALGQRLIKQHKAFQDGRSALEIGAMTAVVSHEDITEILSRDSRFKGKYVVVFPEELSTLIDWDGQDHHVRKSLLQKSDMVFSSNSKTRTWCLGLKPYTEGSEAFIEEFKTLKPCIHGSDAHALDQIGVPCALRGKEDHQCGAPGHSCELRYCWVKADPTFEGLKQLLYEPADRVVVQAPDPTPLKNNHTITQVDIGESKVNDELSIVKSCIPFNAGLVAVTGGKGSGKTALVDLLAHCYADRRNTRDPNSFVRRVVGEAPQLSTGLTFKDGTVFEKKLSEDKIFDASSVVYIAQGELEHYIGDDSDLDTYIRDLIFQSPQVKNSVKVFEFEGIAATASEILADLEKKHQTVDQLERETSDAVIDSVKLEERRANAEIKDLQARLSELEGRLSEEKLEVTRKRQEEIATLQTRKEKAQQARGLAASVGRFVDQDIPKAQQEIGAVNSLLKELGVGQELPALTYDHSGRLGAARTAIESTLREAIEKLEGAERDVKKYEAEMQEHAKDLTRKAELLATLEKAKERIREINDGRTRLATTRQQRSDLFATLINGAVAERDKYAEIIALFGSEKTEVLADLDFIAKLAVDEATLLATAEEMVDNRQVEIRGDEKVPSVFEPLLNLYRSVCTGDTSKVGDLVKETDRLASELRSKLKKSHALGVVNLDKCLYGRYLGVVPTVTYKKTALGKLSLGQKATVLVKIYLAQGTNPIIIDSHDDHLDNEFIMEELVGAIRQAKGYRQVVLASNNGNVVINSDAEQIVIANRSDGSISYVSGSIENPEIRERALKVLEGGDIAFRKRQEKYRIGPYR